MRSSVDPAFPGMSISSHDTHEAVHVAYGADRVLPQRAGYSLEVEVERDAFVEALVRRAEDVTRVQWAQDSAFRFFPLVEHLEMGLSLHPFDLAANKVLAAVGRAEPRGWVDTISCDERLQPLGYLAWAAGGKDPGLNPSMILDEAGRSARYTDMELAELEFDGERPSALALALQWKRILKAARQVVAVLPGIEVARCVMDSSGELARLSATELAVALRAGSIGFHSGTLRGAFPRIA